MLYGQKAVRAGLKPGARLFSCCTRRAIDIKGHQTVDETVDFINREGTADPDFQHANTYRDIINHHDNRLKSELEQKQTEKEYSDLYTLSLQLSKLLETTPDVSEDFKKEILNLLVEKFTKYNYAVSTLALKKLLDNKDSLSPDSINELIAHNPGRVESSWDLYNSLKPHQCDDTILVSTLNKLLHGDPVEIKEGLNKVDVDKLAKILMVYAKVGDKSLIQDPTSLELVKTLVELDCGAVVTQMCIPSSVLETVINNSEKYNLKNIDYLFFYEASINNGVSLSGNSLLKSLMPISKLQLTPVVESANLKLLREKLDVQTTELAPLPEVVDEIREQIQELSLDDTASVMIQMVKSAGFYSKDLQTAIRYFQHYQSKIPDGTPEQNSLKSTMSLVFVYDCIVKNDPKMVNVAEALVPQSPLPDANNLASLVLFHGWFGDSDRAFDIYNQASDLFLKPMEGNESNRGVLAQALTIVSLLGKEVGLAKLIKEKCLEKNIIDQTYEIKLSNILKEYGDKIEECKDDEGAFRESMKKTILRTIIEMSP